MTQTTAKERLHLLAQDIQSDFIAHRSVMSFHEFFELFLEHPKRHSRSVAQYIRDAFLHFGTESISTPRGTVRRFSLFDMAFHPGRTSLVGQEDAQNGVFRTLNNFIRERRITRLVLLHGPNGSAKSSLIHCVFSALEHYSHHDDGALYRFNWIFPTEKMSRAAIGFGDGSNASAPSIDSFANLDDLDIDAKLLEELKDNPLFLIPKPQRQALLLELFGPDARSIEGDLDDRFILSDYIFEGDLSYKSRRIFDALLTSFNGDLDAVLKHVQVERFYISRRYRHSAVTVGPQMRVDASSRQITVDRSLNALPASLQNQTLFEPYGPLVDGNRGMVEFNDFLKRHPDLNKYLLDTGENGTVPLEHAILFIDTFLIGSANEEFLNAFKNQAEYLSFKGRLDLIRMPYLLDFRTEERIYQQMLDQTDIPQHVAPHTTHTAALWAVLTRLIRPQADAYPALIHDIISNLAPIDKAVLYATGRTPEGLPHEKARELRNSIETLLEEGRDADDYEGRYGISPREMKNVLLRASQNDDFPCLSPLSLFAELRKLVRDTTVHPFLRLPADGDYRKPGDLINTVVEHYLDLLDTEIRTSMGLVDEARYEEYLSRYINTVSHWIKNEQMHNPITGAYEDPSEDFMSEVEKTLGVSENPKDFRADIISTIAAFRIDNPDSDLDLNNLFAAHYDTLRESFYTDRSKQIKRIEENLLKYIRDEQQGLSAEELTQVETTFSTLYTRFGYCTHCAREAIAFLMQSRYR